MSRRSRRRPRLRARAFGDRSPRAEGYRARGARPGIRATERAASRDRPRSRLSLARDGAWRAFRTCARGLEARRPWETTTSGELFDLDREDEVVLGEPAHVVRPDGEIDLVVVHGKIGMMLLALGDLGDPVQELHRGHEILERERLMKLVPLRVPTAQLTEKLTHLARSELGAAVFALSFGEIHG